MLYTRVFIAIVLICILTDAYAENQTSTISMPSILDELLNWQVCV